MPSPTDNAIKRNYQLAFLRRNYLLKVHEAIKWGLSEEEWKFLDDAWGMKAKNLGKQAEGFLENARKEAKEKFHRMRYQKNTAWADPQMIERQLKRTGAKT